MYYIDTNILIYLNDRESPYHESAAKIFYDLLNQNKVILHEIVLTEFYAIITDSRKMASPWLPSQAKDYIHTLLESISELHFLENEIVTLACKNLEKYEIERYNIYDYLIACSMKFYGIDKIVTLNKADFEQYEFIKEIITPVKDR